MNTLESRMVHNFWRHQQLQRSSINELRNVESIFFLALPSCTVPVMATRQLQNQSLTWWQSKATCSSNSESVEFHYVVELLGEDSCAYLENPPQRVTADYYRITFLGLSKRNKTRVYLQSIMALPHLGGLISGCQDVGHRVTIGRQVWRELI
jgi:hypothetical protein